MKTLEELIRIQKLTQEDDLTIIKRWFIENNREQDGLTLIPALAQAQTEKVQRKYDYALSWIPSLIDLQDCVKDKDAAKKLSKLQTLCALNYPMREDDGLLIWARENIHKKMEVPKLFFRPTIAYLMKYGVEFVMSEQDREWAIRQSGDIFE